MAMTAVCRSMRLLKQSCCIQKRAYRLIDTNHTSAHMMLTRGIPPSRQQYPLCEKIFNYRRYGTSTHRPLNPTVHSSASIDRSSRRLRITWADGDSSEYPFAWLRDNCQCDKCFHPVSLARLSIMPEYNPKISVKTLEEKSADGVTLAWEDGHVSTFSSEWLLTRCFSEKRRHAWRDLTYGPEPKSWDSGHKLIEIEYNDVMTNAQSQYDWLYELHKHGVVLLKNAPAEEMILQKVADQIAYPRKTNYGEKFDVKSKKNPSNVAYTSAGLGLHTDLPFYIQPPGIQMLHCIVQTGDQRGGENQLSDGLRAAEKLKTHHPREYEILTTTLVDYYDYGSDFVRDFHLARKKHVIELGDNGNVSYINYNNQVRNSHLDLPIDAVEDFYTAVKLFDDILYDAASLIAYRMTEGDILTFNNVRVLHGRAGFTATNSDRFLQGIYVEWDEAHSRLRRVEEILRHGEH